MMLLKFALRNLQEETVELTMHQKVALKGILNGKDTLACLPTSHGKYIILECLPHCHDHLYGMVICRLSKGSHRPCLSYVSPLILLK